MNNRTRQISVAVGVIVTLTVVMGLIWPPLFGAMVILLVAGTIAILVVLLTRRRQNVPINPPAPPRPVRAVRVRSVLETVVGVIVILILIMVAWSFVSWLRAPTAPKRATVTTPAEQWVTVSLDPGEKVEITINPGEWMNWAWPSSPLKAEFFYYRKEVTTVVLMPEGGYRDGRQEINIPATDKVAFTALEEPVQFRYQKVPWSKRPR